MFELHLIITLEYFPIKLQIESESPLKLSENINKNTFFKFFIQGVKRATYFFGEKCYFFVFF